jgi:recombinational DNA repair ATPase RecF
MKIKRIEIRDFRGIPSLELDFINPESNSTLETIVLAGPNGSGKTSILEAILLCLNCVDLLTNRPRVFNIKHSARNFHRVWLFWI